MTSTTAIGSSNTSTGTIPGTTTSSSSNTGTGTTAATTTSSSATTDDMKSALRSRIHQLLVRHKQLIQESTKRSGSVGRQDHQLHPHQRHHHHPQRPNDDRVIVMRSTYGKQKQQSQELGTATTTGPNSNPSLTQSSSSSQPLLTVQGLLMWLSVGRMDAWWMDCDRWFWLLVLQLQRCGTPLCCGNAIVVVVSDQCPTQQPRRGVMLHVCVMAVALSYIHLLVWCGRTDPYASTDRSIHACFHATLCLSGVYAGRTCCATAFVAACDVVSYVVLSARSVLYCVCMAPAHISLSTGRSARSYGDPMPEDPAVVTHYRFQLSSCCVARASRC